jgi:hypothetical protein
MWRFVAVAVAAGAGGLFAAPVPPEASKLVSGLSDPDEKVRGVSSAALRGRADALPWLRRAARSVDTDTARRAAALLAACEPDRQGRVAKAIDACIRDGCLDLLTEWHQYWKPHAEEDLWSVGLRTAKPGLDRLAKSCPPAEWAWFEQKFALFIDPVRVPTKVHNGPCPERFEAFKGTWTIRTDRMDRLRQSPRRIRFASIGGPAKIPRGGGQFLVLGPVQANTIDTAFVACDGEVWNEAPEFGPTLGVTTARSIVVCRGNFTGASLVGASVLLADGNIDLTRTHFLTSCLIRASGEVYLRRDTKPQNCTIEAHAKDAMAPYKFFELSDVGLLLADDEEGLVVTGVKAGAPFGDCGIRKGDLIRAIDDTPAGNSEEFRKKVRRAMVRQGDCLITVVRGEKTLDLPVFFPLPK